MLKEEPLLDVPGMTEFEIPGSNMLLGLMPETGIAKILGSKTTHPSVANGVPRCELYLPSDDPDENFENAVRGQPLSAAVSCVLGEIMFRM